MASHFLATVSHSKSSLTVSVMKVGSTIAYIFYLSDAITIIWSLLTSPSPFLPPHPDRTALCPIAPHNHLRDLAHIAHLLRHILAFSRTRSL
jgi:hypothetical protein